MLAGTISLPYANVSEPFAAYTDFGNNRQRIDYYGGIDSYIYRGDMNVSLVNECLVINTYGIDAFSTPFCFAIL